VTERTEGSLVVSEGVTFVLPSGCNRMVSPAHPVPHPGLVRSQRYQRTLKRFQPTCEQPPSKVCAAAVAAGRISRAYKPNSAVSLDESTAAWRAAWSRSFWPAYASAKDAIARSKTSLVPR
jgi:hypothetical protein